MLMQRTTRPRVSLREVRALVGTTKLGVGLNSPQLKLFATVVIIFRPRTAVHGADMILAPGVKFSAADFEYRNIKET